MTDIISEPEGGRPPVQEETGRPVLQEAPVAATMSPVQVAAARRLRVRIWCVSILLSCVAMLGIGLWLTPDARGYETHRQLGLLPCGFFRVTGMPCPTCGCTTAVSNFSHGHLIRSFLTQPFGFLVALVATLLVPLTLVGAVTGRWIGPSMFWMQWHWRLLVFGGLAWLVFGWGFKVVMVWMVK